MWYKHSMSLTWFVENDKQWRHTINFYIWINLRNLHTLLNTDHEFRGPGTRTGLDKIGPDLALISIKGSNQCFAMRNKKTTKCNTLKVNKLLFTYYFNKLLLVLLNNTTVLIIICVETISKRRFIKTKEEKVFATLFSVYWFLNTMQTYYSQIKN